MFANKKAVAAVLSLVLGASQVALAEESACVKAFRKADLEYQKKQLELDPVQMGATGIMVSGAAGAGWCFLRSPTVMGKLGCALLGGIPLIAGGGGHWYASSRLSRMSEASGIYQTYRAYKDDGIKNSEDAQSLLSALGVDKQQEDRAMRELVTLMEWGSLCEGAQPRSVKEVVELMKGRLHSPN